MAVRREYPEEEVSLHSSHSAAISGSPSLSGSTKSVDFEKAIKETGYGKFNYLLILLAFPASCSTTFDTTSLSYALPTASCDLNLNAYHRGYLFGAIYAGMIVSAFFWGFMSDRYGRQRVLAFGYLGDFLFGIATSLSQDFWTLLVFKFLSGVMISGPFSSFMSYLSELFNVKYRDSVILMVGLFQAIGGIVQPLIAWAIIPLSIHWSLWDGRIVINSWRVFLMLCVVPSVVACIGTSFCHESPRFLLAKGRKDEALNVFRYIYSVNSGRPANTYSVKRLKSDTSSPEVTRKLTFWQEITAVFRPPYLYKTLLVFTIQFGCLLTLNSIRLWLPQLFTYIRLTEQPERFSTCEILSSNNSAVHVIDCDNFAVDTSVYSNMLLVSLLTSISFAICTAIIGSVGKRNLLVTLFLAQSAVICTLGWVRPPLTMVLAGIFVSLSNTTGIGLIGFVVQIFPTRLRAMSVSLTMMFGRLGVVIGNAVLPYFLKVTCPGTFVGVSVITLTCGLVLFLLAAAASKSDINKQSQSEA